MTVIIFTTFPDMDTAEKISLKLVNDHLAACVNLIPGCKSIYRWEGKVHNEGEVVAMVKTKRDRADELLERLSNMHPYMVPEGIMVSLEGGLDNYLDWIEKNTDPDRKTKK